MIYRTYRCLIVSFFQFETLQPTVSDDQLDHICDFVYIYMNNAHISYLNVDNIHDIKPAKSKFVFVVFVLIIPKVVIAFGINPGYTKSVLKNL